LASGRILFYRAANPEAVEQIARYSRSFMPANARIIPDQLSGTLLVTDTALNLKKLYTLIRDTDQKPTAAMKKKWEENEKVFMAEVKARTHQMEAPPKPAPSSH
jgi:hypothetical protein